MEIAIARLVKYEWMKPDDLPILIGVLAKCVEISL